MEEHWSGKKENHHEQTFLSKCARSPEQTKTFGILTDGVCPVWCSVNTVQILTMMENDVADGEQEIQTLKEMLKTLNSEAELQKEQRQEEIETLKLQLQQAQESIVRLLSYSKESDASVEIKHERSFIGFQESVNGQLKTLLEENVALQKQLIRSEEKLLTSRLKKRTDMKDRGE